MGCRIKCIIVSCDEKDQLRQEKPVQEDEFDVTVDESLKSVQENEFDATVEEFPKLVHEDEFDATFDDSVKC